MDTREILLVRLPPDLKEQLRTHAREQGRSMTRQVEYTLVQSLRGAPAPEEPTS